MDWYPAQFFNPAAPPPSSPFALLVLNQPINQNAYTILKKHASFTICADGGANHLYNLMRKSGRESIELPDAIVGDLDSISPKVRKHYEDLQVPIIYDPSQYSTDVTKCLSYLRSRTQSINAPRSSKNGAAVAAAPSASTGNENDIDINVLLLGGLGGRVDQAFSLINHLYLSSTSSSSPTPTEQRHLYLISEESISFLLHRGRNRIHVPGGSLMGVSPSPAPSPPSQSTTTATTTTTTTQTTPFAENVGIIPIAGPAAITTQGLEWDIHDWKTRFGGQVSSSNHVRSEVVEVLVESEGPVLFTIELAGWLKGGEGL
ncbi:thiamine pyrophosphokinase Thi80 [Blastomyces dermatitidis ER-3]|uniref:Thiamine pyrophosphokinase n=1 Tax=Ajellomyces dermatitidis (strain ER-3 / ATCC MYA-2586) TaxID=559297 RepID=A0ABP2EUD2_AJEDR|nr:thiamine pyrophosphokinase Thi80 [Blastomyces dermatitidis ER-3]EEQ87530.1 thiamine pyrophosphokinase Thi80 [Blastomyces dermatitidis ER-3]